MAIYKQPLFNHPYFGQSRSDAYKFTVTSKDDPSVIALKKSVASHNASVRANARAGAVTLRGAGGNWRSGAELQRVSFMARGARRDADGKALHRNCDSNLNHKFAREFDVYVHSDGPNTHFLQRELDTGMTPGQLRKVDAAAHAKWKMEMELDAELRKNGIVATFENGEKIYISREEQIRRLEDAGVNQSIIDRLF